MTTENNYSDALLFELDADSIKEEILQEEAGEMTPLAPRYGSEGWSDYVMSQFDKSEMFDGNPTCAGLRRVAELLLGDIVVSRPSQVWPATDAEGPGRATVVFEVIFDWMNSGQMRTYSEVADVWNGNPGDVFCAHPVATASTRAEGRALRKALKVKCLAAEELTKKDVVGIVQAAVSVTKPSSGEWQEEAKITTHQINFINTKCKQLDVNVLKFINLGKNTYDSIESVTKAKAIEMLNVLNDFQSNGDIPDNCKGYDNGGN